MKIDEFLDLARKRRSVRRFRPDPVPNEYIRKMIEAGRWAMSGANGQPWEFIVIKDKKTKGQIAKFYLEVRKEQYVIEQTRVEELRHFQLAAPPVEHAGIREAPVLIVVCGDRRTLQASISAIHFIPATAGPECIYVENMANAIFSLHLAAAALGLGSQWVSTSRVVDQPIKALLDIPDLLEIHALIPVGYPAHDASPPYRRELEEILHYEKYDRTKFRSGEEIAKFLLKLRNRTQPAYLQEKEKGP